MGASASLPGKTHRRGLQQWNRGHLPSSFHIVRSNRRHPKRAPCFAVSSSVVLVFFKRSGRRVTPPRLRAFLKSPTPDSLTPGSPPTKSRRIFTVFFRTGTLFLSRRFGSAHTRMPGGRNEVIYGQGSVRPCADCFSMASVTQSTLLLHLERVNI